MLFIWRELCCCVQTTDGGGEGGGATGGQQVDDEPAGWGQQDGVRHQRPAVSVQLVPPRPAEPAALVRWHQERAGVAGTGTLPHHGCNSKLVIHQLTDWLTVSSSHVTCGVTTSVCRGVIGVSSLAVHSVCYYVKQGERSLLAGSNRHRD